MNLERGTRRILWKFAWNILHEKAIGSEMLHWSLNSFVQILEIQVSIFGMFESHVNIDAAANLHGRAQ